MRQLMSKVGSSKSHTGISSSYKQGVQQKSYKEEKSLHCFRVQTSVSSSFWLEIYRVILI